MRNVARWAGLLAVLAAALLYALPAGAQTPEQVKAATAAAVRKLSLQTELPREQHDKDVTPRNNDMFGWIKPLGETWAWIIIALVTAMLLFAFREQILTLMSGRASWQRDGEPSEALTPETAARTGAVADDLASQGNYMEAMHLLLLRALTEMRQRLGAHFADSLTSREILRHAKLGEPGKTSLRDIIARVELCWFGEYPVAVADYTACRESFDRFVLALDKERNA